MIDWAPMNLRRERVLIWWGVALPCWILALCLLAPTVTRGGDCGELISASYRLGIAHPSGYPVWCLIGRIFALLPFGEVGWRYNLFSSVCGALATGTLALAAHRLVWHQIADKPNALVVARWSALGAGWLLGGSYYVASQFLIAEVYALAALMGALLLNFALAWHYDNDWRDALTLALLAGLVPVVHLSGVFFLPWLLVLAVWKRGLKPRQLALAGAFFVCALLPVLYLPIRSAQFPAPPPSSIDASFYWPLDWSHPATVGALRQHVSAAQYRRLLVKTTTQTVNGQTVTRRELAQNPAKIPGRLRELARFITFEYLWATPLLLLGAWRAFADPRVGWALLLTWLSNVATQINYNVSDQSNFFFPAYLVMALWLGLGLSVFLGALLKRGGIGAAFAPLSVLATVIVQWAIFAPSVSQFGLTRTRDGALQQADAAQTAARQSGNYATILFGSDDEMWAFWYAKYDLNRAPDVATPWGRLVYQEALGKNTPRFVAQLKRNGPVFLGEWNEATDARFPLVMATPSGNLLLASDRKLPPPAQLLETAPDKLTPGANGLQSARFRRVELWKVGESATLPNLAIASLAAFDVDFRAPNLPTPAPTGDWVAGQIQVLIAPVGTFGTRGPLPTQSASAADTFNADRTLVTLQRRRLVLPAQAKPNALYRASVPIFLDADSVVGPYQIWTRIVANADKTTPWTLSDEAFLTQR